MRPSLTLRNTVIINDYVVDKETKHIIFEGPTPTTVWFLCQLHDAIYKYVYVVSAKDVNKQLTVEEYLDSQKLHGL